MNNLHETLIISIYIINILSILSILSMFFAAL